jgi:hypothetical protein
MENNETNNSKSLAKETGKAFVYGTATTVGMWTGLFLVGLAIELKEKYKARKNPQSEPNET